MEPAFLSQVASLTIPMAIQNLINTGVMAADVIMIGRVGEKVLSGSSLAGQIYFILNLIMFGTASGASVLIAQYWGRQDRGTIEKVMGIAIRITFSVAFVFWLLTLLIPDRLMLLFTTDPVVIGYGVQYLAIVKYTYLIEAFSLIYLSLIRNIERVIISTIVYSVQLVVNVVGNAILIYGLLGMPALGIRGAAYSTLIARLVGLVIVIIYAVWVNDDVKVRIRYIFKTDRALNHDFMKYSLAVIVNELLWSLGISLNASIIGHLGSEAVAAQSVANVVRQLAMVLTFGIANSAAIMIGKEIGKGKTRVAERYGAYFVRLALLFGLLGGLLILLVRPFVIRGMNFSGTVADYANTFLLIMSYYCFFASFTAVSIVGIFRAGGDTKVGLIIDCSTMYFGSILLGFIAAFVLKLPVKAVFAILMCDEVLKMPICVWRYRKKYWLTNVTRDF